MYGLKINKDSGFTLIELIIVMIVFMTLLGLASINLLNSQDTVNIESSMNVLINDMKSQQNQAMIGSTSGQTPEEYGIYFEPTQYTLFKGSAYSSSSPTNHVIELSPSLLFSTITLPSETIVFSRGDGEFENFVDGQNSITITNTNGGESRTILINRFGTIDQAN